MRRGLFAAVLLLALLSRGDARACAFIDEGIEDETTFEPRVLGPEAKPGFFYDPHHSGFGEGCADCVTNDVLADWAAHLGGKVSPIDWKKVLLQASLGEIDGLIFFLNGKAPAPPEGYGANTVLESRFEPKKMVAALYFVGFARRVEEHASLGERGWTDGGKKKGTEQQGRELQQRGDAALLRATDPFLRQRYAFQLLRLRFYRRAWDQAVAFHDQHQVELAGPSASLRWQARHYLAGALLRSGKRPRGNLELARVYTGYPPLAATVAAEFRPLEEKDWQQSLALAATPQERVDLWSLAGLKADALVAMQAIFALAPGSDRLAPLSVRELNRVEQGHEPYEPIAALEKLALAIARTKGADRPWVLWLVAAHAAALRHDLPAVRERVAAARKTNPSDAMIDAQARASLAMVLAASGDRSPATLDEVAHAAYKLPDAFTRKKSVVDDLRRALAAYAPAAERELLLPTSTYGVRDARWKTWQDPAFIKALIERFQAGDAEYDRFVRHSSGYTAPGLLQELALAHLRREEFAQAAKVFATTEATSVSLGADPFAQYVRDQDPRAFANATLTHRTFAERLVELQKAAAGGGEKGAEATLQIAAALYNITRYGNARSVLSESHNFTTDTAEVVAWAERAFDLTKARELKAKAAFLAAKGELAQLIESEQTPYRGELPVPYTWFPVVKQLADTSYHQEILAECGHYRRWAKR